MNTRSIPSSPYKGLIPYSEEDAPFFFGREQKREIITDNLMASRLTVLYGPSGVGKSSVLRAGVAYHLRQKMLRNLTEDGQPEYVTVVFNSWRDDPVIELASAVRDSVAEAMNDRTLVDLPPSRNLSQSLQTCTKLKPDDELPAIDLLIILDQFEEYFLYHANEEGEGTFAQEFPQVVTAPNLCINFLISIRDDALAKLDFFKRRIPSLFENRLSIEHLDQKSARDAIVKPLKEYNRLLAANGEQVIEPEAVEAVLAQSGRQVGIDPALVDAILEQIKTGRVLLAHKGRGAVESNGPLSPTDTQVETPHLQLVLSRLWEEEMAAGSRVMRLETLKRLGGASRIVQTHLDKTMDSLPPGEQNIAARIFYHLVTPSGSKIAHTISDLASFAELSQEQLIPVLIKLSDNPGRILRAVAAPSNEPSAQRYEIFHDVLASAILDWRTRHIHKQRQSEAEQLAARQAAEREKEASAQLKLEQAEALGKEQTQRAEEKERHLQEQALATRRFQWLTVALAAMFLLAVGTTIFAFIRKSQADANAIAASANAVAAADARRIAEQERRLADEARQQAIVDRGVAVGQTRLAEDRKRIADEQRVRAEQLQLLANDRATEAVRKGEQNAFLVTQIRKYLEGEALTLEAKGESLKAIEIYDRLLPIYQKAGATERQIEVLTICARLYRRVGQESKAEELELLLKKLRSENNHISKQVKTKL